MQRAIDWRRKLISWCKYIQKCSTLLKWDLVIQEIQLLVCRKKIDSNLQACLCSGHFVFHNSVSLTRLQLPVLNSCLLYQASLPYVIEMKELGYSSSDIKI